MQNKKYLEDPEFLFTILSPTTKSMGFKAPYFILTLSLIGIASPSPSILTYVTSVVHTTL